MTPNIGNGSTDAADGALLEVDGVTCRFGGLTALDGVSLRVGYGEVIGLIGPNGSGKTTLINVITGICRPTDGRVRLAGRDLVSLPRYAVARQGVARTFQEPRLFASLGALGHVALALPEAREAPSLAMLGRSWRRHAPQAVALLNAVGLGSDLETRPASLPYGRRRLLELARCLASRPALLLLDEPTAGLTDAEGAAVGRLLRSVTGPNGPALVIVDHRIPFLRKVCPRLVVLDQGILLADGPTGEVLADSRVIAAYLGEV